MQGTWLQLRRKERLIPGPGKGTSIQHKARFFSFYWVQDTMLRVRLSPGLRAKGQKVNNEQTEPHPWEETSHLKGTGVMFLTQNTRQRAALLD